MPPSPGCRPAFDPRTGLPGPVRPRAGTRAGTRRRRSCSWSPAPAGHRQPPGHGRRWQTPGAPGPPGRRGRQGCAGHPRATWPATRTSMLPAATTTSVQGQRSGQVLGIDVLERHVRMVCCGGGPCSLSARGRSGHAGWVPSALPSRVIASHTVWSLMCSGSHVQAMQAAVTSAMVMMPARQSSIWVRAGPGPAGTRRPGSCELSGTSTSTCP